MKRILLLLITAIALASCSQDDASIGIIGGADGPAAVVVGSKAETLAEMPEIDGIPTPPGDFESASRNSSTTVIVTGNVTEVMKSAYVSQLTGDGFRVYETDGDMTAMILESERFTVTLILDEDRLTTTVSEK